MARPDKPRAKALGAEDTYMKSPRIHLPFLDIFRGIAILLVFLFHSLHAAYDLQSCHGKACFGIFRLSIHPWSFIH